MRIIEKPKTGYILQCVSFGTSENMKAFTMNEPAYCGTIFEVENESDINEQDSGFRSYKAKYVKCPNCGKKIFLDGDKVYFGKK